MRYLQRVGSINHRDHIMAAKPKTGRTRVVPNWKYDHHHHWPSSSMSMAPSHFFKIILPSTMQEMKLSIPEKFVSEFGDELSSVAKLTVPYGRIWHVGLEKSDKNIWFGDGWQDFVEYHSICYGYFLVFRYEGNSNFHVLVFDKTATEIQYPSSKNCKMEDQVDIMKLGDANISKHYKLDENEISDSDELLTKHEVREKFLKKRFSGTSSKKKFKMSRGRERALQAARMLKPKNPSFIGVLRPNYMQRYIMYVPVQFAVKYLSQPKIVKLQTSNGKQWPAKCILRDRASSAMNIGRGWTLFSRDNNLEEGDVCVFELIKKQPVVLKVSIFRVVDYAV